MLRLWPRNAAAWNRLLLLAAYLLALGLMAGAFAQYYIPSKGFSYLVSFGGKQTHRPVEALKDVDYYVQADSSGYDAQFYAQIAMDPTLRDPGLAGAVDNLPYRARRILMPAVSYVMGWGNPAAILNAFALQNAISWLALAGLLFWWFPPVSWQNWFRWSGVLFSFGVCLSLRNSLIDGPSLTLIAAGLFFLEKRRPGWATALLALSGLAKETNLIAGAALLRPDEITHPRRWGRLILRGAFLVLPLALWLVYIDWQVGTAVDAGVRNFGWPFVAYAQKWSVVWSELLNPQYWAYGLIPCTPLWSFTLMVALSVQFLFFLIRPDWKQPWWRVAIGYAALMVVLGGAVWEGYPGAAARVLLPMQLAFNVLVPRGKRWWAILLLGNLTLFAAPALLQPPAGSAYRLDAPSRLVSSAEKGRLRVIFSPQWHAPERLGDRYWRWSRASSAITFVNPQAYDLEADFDFILSSLDPREITVRGPDGAILWRGGIKDAITRIHLESVRLRPGENRFEFITHDAGFKAQLDPRRLSFCLKNWVVKLRVAPEHGVRLTGSTRQLGGNGADGLELKFAGNWYAPERRGALIWRWTNGPAQLVLVNHSGQDMKAHLSFTLGAISKRMATLSTLDGRILWKGEVASKHSEDVALELVLQPGENTFIWKSDHPSGGADNDTRLLDLCVRDLALNLAPANGIPTTTK